MASISFFFSKEFTLSIKSSLGPLFKLTEIICVTNSLAASIFLNKNIKKVAVLGGSGSFAIQAAKASGADAFVTADLKYHDFFSAENQIILADIGHYESEQYTKNFLADLAFKPVTFRSSS